MNAFASILKFKRLDILAVFAVGAVLVCIASFQYLASGFLHQDDAILVGAPLFGGKILMPTNFLHYWIIYALSASSSMLIVKSYIWLSISIILGSFYFIVSRLSGLKWPSAALAIIFVFYPVSVDQSFFVSGAHPTAATAAFFVYLVLLLFQLTRGLRAGARFNFGVAALQAIVLYASGLISPTYNLAPFLLLISTAAYLISAKAWRDRIHMRIGLGLILIAILPAALQIGNLNNFHYANAPGYVSYSLNTMVSNLRIALETIVVYPFRGRPAFAALYIILLLAVAAIFGFALTRPRKTSARSAELRARLRIAASMGAVLIVSAALLFGPPSIVTSFVSRYALPAYMSGALLIAIFLSIALAGVYARRRLIRAAFNLLLISAAFLVSTHYIVATRAALKPRIASHELIADALGGRTWRPDDQVLIVLPEKSADNSGLNHWSTWQIRTITGQRDIIGLIGKESRLADLQRNGLFVDKYRDHGGEYWKTISGRATRLKMMGLERDRALYAFMPDDQGRLVPATVTVWERDTISIMPPGARVGERSRKVTPDNLCDIAPDDDGMLIALKPTLPGFEAFDVIADESFSFDGRKARNVSIDVGEDDLAYVSLRLDYGGQKHDQAANEYSDVYPPMPLLAPDLAIYNEPNQYRVLDRNNKMNKMVAREPISDDGALKLTLVGCPGRIGFVFLNDTFAGVLHEPKFSGTWRFGKGIKERYWRGEVREFRVGVLKRDNRGE